VDWLSLRIGFSQIWPQIIKQIKFSFGIMLYNFLGDPRSYGLNSFKNMVTLGYFFKKTICKICSLFIFLTKQQNFDPKKP
jgi:hypothetical protein